MKTQLVLLALLSSFLLPPAALLAQGSLTPPGAPAPTMKTLDQVEPRTDVMKLGGDASNQYIISTPGSYYLTTNLNGVSGKNGISLQSDNVTLDLNGFALLGLSNATTGIVVPTGRSYIVIRNGTVRGWGLHGVAADKALNSRVEDLLVSSNGYPANGYGILIGTNGLVRGCTAQGNRAYGIYCSWWPCTISGCTASANTWGGIHTWQSSTISGCTATGNGDNGIETDASCTVSGCTANENVGNGIRALVGCTLTSCTAGGNTNAGIFLSDGGTLTGSTARGNGGIGIQAGQRSLITGCTASANRSHGLQVAGAGVVLNNSATGNGVGGVGQGINVTGSGSRIDGNHVRDNTGWGILAGTGDIIVRNTAGANTSGNYSPSTGANFGPVQSPNTATSPWANF